MRRTVAGLTLGYLLAFVAIIRGFLDYWQESVVHIIIIAAIYAVTIAISGTLRRKWSWGGHALAAIHLGLMVWAFLVAPLADTWALLVLPTCILAFQDYKPKVGWAWFVINSVVMSVMLIFAETLLWAPQFIAIYVAAYVLVSGYSLSLKRAEVASQRNATLVAELQVAHDRLREYAEGVADLSAMRERNRLARDLHDSVTQTIFSMTLITQSSLILHKRGSPELEEKLEQLHSLGQSALTEMRALITELRDAGETAVPLEERIRQVVAGVNGDGQPEIDVLVSEGLPAVGSMLGQEVSGIVQEALNNVVKHARASRVTVSAREDRGHLVIRVEDDGAGFDVRSEPPTGHIGLSSMNERARELDAQLSVTSAPGKGTAVQLTVPLPAIAAITHIEGSVDG